MADGKKIDKRKREAMKYAKEYFAGGKPGGRTVKDAEGLLKSNEGLAAAKKSAKKYQRELDRPSTYMKNRVSTKEDRKSLEGNQLSEGSRIHTGRGTRKMTKAEGKHAFEAKTAKAKRLSSDHSFERSRRAHQNVRNLEAIKKLAEKKKKAKKKG